MLEVYWQIGANELNLKKVYAIQVRVKGLFLISCKAVN